jgi:hypothetical protein
MSTPYQVPFTQQLVVVDYRHAVATSQPAAGGTCTALVPAVPADETWLVDRMTVLCTSTTDTEARVYIGSADGRNLVDGSISGNLDIADESQPVLADSGDELRCVWTGATDGAVGTFRIQYRLVQRRGEFAVGS